MRVSIVAIGDEIVGGLTTDTNSGFVAEQCRAVGVEPVAVFAATDDDDAVRRALRRALADADVAICTGGLGPTADDLTTACVARLAERPLVLDEPSLAAIRERFRARGTEMSSNNRKQALFPEGSTVVPNARGTAPGFICAVPVGDGVKHVVCLPGVPREMRPMMCDTVVPWLQSRNPSRRFASRVFSTFGLAESRLDELLAGVVEPAEARLAFRAAFPQIQARLTVSGVPAEDLEARLDALEARVRERLGHHLYGTGDEGMEAVVGRLLLERNLTLAVAESCTGGLIGHRITNVPGSSAYFLLGLATYAYDAKRNVLGVNAKTLAQWGAVSTQTAEEMAAGARRIGGADLGLATTGIAGPGGGTPDKPVGTVCIGLAWAGGAWSRRYDLSDRGRSWLKETTAQSALNRLRLHLLDTGEKS